MTITKTKIIEIVADEKLHPDGIPDKYQALVSFSVINGHFTDGTTTYQILVNLYDDNNKLSEDGYYVLTDDDIPTSIADASYDQNSGGWVSPSPYNYKINRDMSFRISYSPIQVVPPNPVPSP